MTRTVTPVTRTSYTMMAKTIRALELHYPMIQFLIKAIIANTGIKSKVYFYFGPDESIVLKQMTNKWQLQVCIAWRTENSCWCIKSWHTIGYKSQRHDIGPSSCRSQM